MRDLWNILQSVDIKRKTADLSIGRLSVRRGLEAPAVAIAEAVGAEPVEQPAGEGMAQHIAAIVEAAAAQTVADTIAVPAVEMPAAAIVDGLDLGGRAAVEQARS